MKIRVVNGPNLALLGKREPGIYGCETLNDIVAGVRRRAEPMGVEIDAYQSDVEGELVHYIGQSRGVADGLIVNAGAYTHTSIAIRDAIAASGLPCVEVHLSNLHAREPFRHHSFLTDISVGLITGFGGFGYQLALDALVWHLRERKGKQGGPA